MNPDQKNNYWQQDPDEGLNTPDQTTANLDQPDQIDNEVVDNARPQILEEPPVTWTAHEYLTADKGGLWYVIFTFVILALIAVDIFFLKSWTFSALVVVMAIAVIVYSRRPARTIQYALSGRHGLYVGERLYNFADFKAFGLIRDGEHHSIMLIPTKRFAPGVSVYFPEEAGEKIVDILGARLPMETLKLDIIDIIVRQLRL